MPRLRTLIATALVAGAAGCMEVDTLVTVTGDGSGTLSERLVLTGPMARMMEKLGAQDGGVIDHDELRSKARAMGEGVTLLSAQPLPAQEGLGYVAVFAFRDVTALRVDQGPGAGRAPGAGEGPAPRASFATFGFQPGPRPVLTVRTHDGERPFPDPGMDPPGNGGQLVPELLREMLAGLRVAMAVEVAGEIVETNASHRDGNRVTLLELDFDRILGDAEGIKLLQDSTRADSAKLKSALKGIPGVKIELEPEVRITFTPQPLRADAPTPPITRAGAGRSARLPGERAHEHEQRGAPVAVLDGTGAVHEALVGSAAGGGVTLRRATTAAR